MSTVLQEPETPDAEATIDKELSDKKKKNKLMPTDLDFCPIKQEP